MCKRLLPLIPAGLSVIQVLPDPERITVVAQPRSRTAACVSCGHPSWRVHSTYQRCLCDLPWQGRIIQIHVRRLAIPIIPDTLLRLILRTPAPPRPTPPVLGLDDWAYHKRHRNGTILVDLA